MPNLDITRLELELLIECVAYQRTELNMLPEDNEKLPDLHLKLENALELWINGATIELPIPEHFRKLGVSKWEKEYPPHDEGIKND